MTPNAAFADATSPAAAIVGMGALFPGAGNLDTYWHNIINRVDAISSVPSTRVDPSYFSSDLPPSADRIYCGRGGFVDDVATFDPVAFGIMPVVAQNSEPDQLLAMKVAAAAVADAGGQERLGDLRKVGVIVGRGGYTSAATDRLIQRVVASQQLTTSLRELVPGITDAQLSQVRERFQGQLGTERPEAAIGLVPNLSASRIANRLDLQGPSYVVDAACASSLLAIDQALGELNSGRCDAVVAGGVHHCQNIIMWSVFSQLRALSKTEQIRPLSAKADGMLIGEGTGMVVLKRLADAERDGDHIYAVVRGTGVASDGRGSTLMSPRVAGQVIAVEQAWRRAGLDPTAKGSVGLIEAHGTATPVGDAAEIDTLRQVFGDGIAGDGSAVPAEIGIGSVKSMIGHAMPAAGIAGIIKAAMAIDTGILPPTLHCDEPNSALAGSRFAPITTAREWNSNGAPRRAAVNAFGFGGINAHVVLEQAHGAGAGNYAAVKPIAAEVEPTLLLSGSTVADLADQLNRSDAELIASASGIPPADVGDARLAIINPNAKRLELARKIVTRGRAWRGRNDVYFEPTPLLDNPNALTFVFPGLEINAPDTDIAALARHFSLPQPPLRNGSDTIEKAVDVIAISRLINDSLAKLSVKPDVLAGHSLGEWTAMIVAGVYERDAIDSFVDELAPGLAGSPNLVYGALGCAADRALDLLGDSVGVDNVVLSHDNCPNQSVICGEPDKVEAALETLRENGVLGQLVPIRTGFHVPMIEPFLGPAHDALESLPLQKPDVPVWSATSVSPFPDDPKDVRELVIRHLVEPVRFRQLTESLYESGARVFVQVGRGSLPGFIEDTLRGKEHLVVAADVASRAPLDQLRRVLSAVWVAGGSPDFAGLPLPQPSSKPASRSSAEPRLIMGAPIVHFDPAAIPTVTSRATARPEVPAEQAAHPVFAEFDALLNELDTDARTIIDTWQHGGPPSPVAVAAPVTAPVAAPVTKRVSEIECSLDTMPELIDHCLTDVPQGWPDPTDRFPVVPLTVMLDMMAREAQSLVPNKVLLGWADVRALRWLIVAPPSTAKLVSNLQADRGDGITRVGVSIEGHSSATILLADEYPEAPAPNSEPLVGQREPEHNVPELYTERWAFHGPRFQAAERIICDADNGAQGVLRNLETPGALLDAAGQLIGHWAQVRLEQDRTVFPISVDELRLYAPFPAVDALLTQTVWMRDVQPKFVKADADIVDADGKLWCRITGWAKNRFSSDEITWAMKFHPEAAGAGEMQPQGWCLVQERWPDTATRELAMRGYLNAAERAQYDPQTPIAQRQWLLGRIAAKDAVRNYLWTHGQPSVYPVELTVLDTPSGVSVVGGVVPHGLNVAIATNGVVGRSVGLSAGIVGFGPVGIDIRPVDGMPSNGGGAIGDSAIAAVATATGVDPAKLVADPPGADGTVRVSGTNESWEVPTRLIEQTETTCVAAWLRLDPKELP